jgi:hypothetical protein
LRKGVRGILFQHRVKIFWIIGKRAEKAIFFAKKRKLWENKSMCYTNRKNKNIYIVFKNESET